MNFESGTRAGIVPPEYDGERLDRLLTALFPAQSRSALARLVAAGHVRVDTQPTTKTSYRVSAGQAIEVDVPPPQATETVPENIPISILFEDDFVAVIDKPAGLVVHPAAGHADGTLVNALLFHVSDLSGIGGEIRPGIVHRLDKDTSGVMVIAKNDAAHQALTSAWNSDAVRKEYLAVVYGTPEQEQGTIDAPIGRDPRDRKRMAVVPSGRRAITRFAIAQRLSHCSLLRCTLLTGRTHQIRVHLKHLGHPIVGDPVYSGPQWHGIPDQRLQKAIAAFPRQALHAVRITFPHPQTGEPMTFEAPLPDDMKRLIEALGQH